MNNYLILVTSSGLRLVEVQEKPNPDWPKYEGDSKMWNDDWDDYQEALQSILSDTSKHIRFKPEYEYSIMCDIFGLMDFTPNDLVIQRAKENVGQTFPLPAGMSVSFEEHCDLMGGCCMNDNVDSGNCKHKTKLAILTPEPSDKVTVDDERNKSQTPPQHYTTMEDIINYIKEKQKEYNPYSSAHKVLRHLECTLPSLFSDSLKENKRLKEEISELKRQIEELKK